MEGNVTDLTAFDRGAVPQLPVETATAAAAERERAAIESRYVVALKRPRDMDAVRAKLLRECQRPGFASVAMYAKPVGNQKIRGLSIRFAEAALRLFGNVMPQASILFDDAERRIIRVSVTDLETNTTYDHEILVEKFVERRTVKQGQEVVGQRRNSQGEIVYRVAATEDDLQNKINAAISKLIRNHGLRLIPGDILEECRRAVEATARDRAAKDPNAERKEIADGFASLNILPEQLSRYLGHPYAEVTPDELVSLREIYQAIRDGETTWSVVLGEKTGDAETSAATSVRAPRKIDPKPPTDDGRGSQPPVGDGDQVDAQDQQAAAAKPNGLRIKPATFGEIFKWAKPYNAKKGTGKANELLKTEFHVETVSDLSEEDGQRYLGLLKAGAETN
jgi:hypothetical protein